MAAKKSRLVEILQSLSTEQQITFSTFVHSEFHNNGTFRRDVVVMWDTIMAYPEALDSESGITGVAFYEMMYPERPFIVGKLDKVASELKVVLRAYLLFEHYNAPENDYWQELAWIQVLRKQQLDSQYDAQITKLERSITSEPQASLDDLMFHFHLEFERYFWSSSKNPGKTEENLGRLIEVFWHAFEAHRLELANALLMRNHIVKLDTQQPHIEKLLETTGFPSNLAPNIVSQVSLNILKLLLKEQPERDDFFSLIELLNTQQNQLKQKEIKNFYTYLRSFCTILVNNSHTEYYAVLHEIQKDNLARGYFYENGGLGALSMLNINRVANWLGHTEWATEFVESHQGKILGESEAGDLYAINKATCLFHKKQYDEVLTLLPTSCENIIYFLFARRLEIMCYFEMKSELTDYKVDAFKMYLRRANEKFLSNSLYEANIGFANILQQILSSSPGDNKRIEKLKGRIDSKTQVAEIKWLLTKCDELKFITKR